MEHSKRRGRRKAAQLLELRAVKAGSERDGTAKTLPISGGVNARRPDVPSNAPAPCEGANL